MNTTAEQIRHWSKRVRNTSHTLAMFTLNNTWVARHGRRPDATPAERAKAAETERTFAMYADSLAQSETQLVALTDRGARCGCNACRGVAVASVSL